MTAQPFRRSLTSGSPTQSNVLSRRLEIGSLFAKWECETQHDSSDVQAQPDRPTFLGHRGPRASVGSLSRAPTNSDSPTSLRVIRHDANRGRRGDDPHGRLAGDPRLSSRTVAEEAPPAAATVESPPSCTSSRCGSRRTATCTSRRIGRTTRTRSSPRSPPSRCSRTSPPASHRAPITGRLTRFETRGLRLGHGVWDVIFRVADTPRHEHRTSAHVGRRSSGPYSISLRDGRRCRRYVRSLAASTRRRHYVLHVGQGLDVLEDIAAASFAPLRAVDTDGATALGRWSRAARIGSCTCTAWTRDAAPGSTRSSVRRRCLCRHAARPSVRSTRAHSSRTALRRR